VGDDEDGDIALAPYPQQEVFEVFPGLGVDRAERLVHEQQHRVAGQGAGDGGALLHAARQLPGVLVPRTSQADGGEGGVGDLTAFGPAAGGAAQRHRHVVPDGQPGEQGPAVVLQDHGEPVGHVVDGNATQHNLPAGRGDQPGDAAQQR
jgi:hypothetical protein